MNHFALEMEKDVYIDEPEELALKVENRVWTSTRVDSIKEVSTYEKNRLFLVICMLKYYLLPTEAWKPFTLQSLVTCKVYSNIGKWHIQRATCSRIWRTFPS